MRWYEQSLLNIDFVKQVLVVVALTAYFIALQLAHDLEIY